MVGLGMKVLRIGVSDVGALGVERRARLRTNSRANGSPVGSNSARGIFSSARYVRGQSVKKYGKEIVRRSGALFRRTAGEHLGSEEWNNVDDLMDC